MFETDLLNQLRKHLAILFLAPLVLFLPAITGTEAPNLHLLPTPQPLQKNLSAVSEPHSVPVPVCFSAHLHKRHLLGRMHTELPPQVLRYISQQESRAWGHADGALFLEPQRYSVRGR